MDESRAVKQVQGYSHKMLKLAIIGGTMINSVFDIELSMCKLKYIFRDACINFISKIAVLPLKLVYPEISNPPECPGRVFDFLCKRGSSKN